MCIAEGVDKVTRFQFANMCYHHEQQCVGSDIEGHAEKHVGAALVELAGNFAVIHIKLKKHVAGWELHLVHIAQIPCAYNGKCTTK